MLILIYFLSIISDQKKASRGGWSDAKITNCVDENRECVEIPFIENSCIYTLNLCQKEQHYFLSFDLSILFSPFSFEYEYRSLQLVKCTENMGLNGFHNGYVIDFNNHSNIYNIKSSGFSLESYTGLPIRLKVNIAINSHYNKYRKEKRHSNKLWYCIDCWNKSKSITQFRKELGIIGDKIKTTKFKF
ncbi:hypothetical protein CDIK_2841, partial [Cucumispora dikerogammari]